MYVVRILRNLTRRRFRTALTVAGITIGIWVLVVMSSMANRISFLVDGGSTYYQDKIIVSDATNPAFGLGLTPMPLSVADQIASVPGVAVAVPEVQLLLDPNEAGGGGFGLPDFIVGAVADADQGRETFQITAAQGRLTTGDDEGSNVVVLGADIARKFGKRAGDSIELRQVEFEVIGVLEPTLTAPDTLAYVPLQAAQTLLAADAPILASTGMGPDQLISQVTVYPEAGADTEVLADAIEANVAQVGAMTGGDFDREVTSATEIFNAIVIGIGLISLVVGGLSVINTMAMSVAERTREIGIKRAIGATRGRIMREIVIEAASIGLLGGLLGLGLGAVVVTVANELGRDSGNILFQLTAPTAVVALAFATVLGAVAGLLPAWNAARLDPVQALRYE